MSNGFPRIMIIIKAISTVAIAFFAALGAASAASLHGAAIPAANWAAPQVAFSGLPPIAGLAVSPQGGLFATTMEQGGLVIQIFGNKSWQVLARTGGQPRGLAFDAAGDLYVAESALGRILRVTPSGQVVVAAERVAGAPLVAPEGVAVARDGAVYFSDLGASRICRIVTSENSAIVTAQVKSPCALAVTANGEQIYVADRSRKIWRVPRDGGKPTEFAEVLEGQPTSMAFDDNGNLYVGLGRSGSDQVVVLNPAGKQILTGFAKRVTQARVAFGGADLQTLFVGDSAAGLVYQIRTPVRAQPPPWESVPSLSIVSPVDGAILNRHDGQVTAEGLKITVKGRSRDDGLVVVNGVKCFAEHGAYQTEITLKAPETLITATREGMTTQATVLWDRYSFPRYRLSTDDNIRFLRDIARHAAQYSSIFDNPYLRMWRDIHRKYGTKIQLNLYYQTDDFNLSQMPDKFKGEWQQNSNWLRLSFHALGNDPDRPYVQASSDQILRDYRLVVGAIERFAGKTVLHPVTTVHWGETTLEAARALRREGIRTLVGYFDSRNELPLVGYYLNAAQWRHLMGHDYWKDTREDITFVRHDIVINKVPVGEIDAFLDHVAEDPHQSEVMELMIHEQHFYSDYPAHEPDFRQRVERALDWVTKRGYKPVFYEDGFLGAPRP